MILFWPISLLIISSGSSGLFTFGCFILCFFENLSRDKLEKGPSKFLAYMRNTIPAKSLWPPSEESPPPLPLFQCCYNDVDFSFDIFLNLQNNIGQGVWGKRKPLSNVIVWDCSFWRQGFRWSMGFLLNRAWRSTNNNMHERKTGSRSDTMESLDSDVNRIAENGDENRQLSMHGKEIQLRKVKIRPFKMVLRYWIVINHCSRAKLK